MWTRDVLKSRAKEVLKINYWKSFLISLVIVFSGANGSGGGGGSAGGSGRNDAIGHILNYRSIFIIAGGVFLLVIAFRILLGYPLEVGGRKYFVQSAQYKDNKGCISFAFDGQNYTNIISTMLLKGIYNFLWTLLFIIPGIIKFYEYRMVPYILGDNSGIGTKRAIELSKAMTDGHKFNMFVLDFSFLGWYFLGALALGIGVFFVNPYAFATEAELYLVLKNNAIQNSCCDYNELN